MGGITEARAVLVIGSGGREHALAWQLARSPQVERVYVAPGNAGTDGGRVVNIVIPITDTPALVAFAREREVALTVVGPEAPLAAGLVDAFQAAGLAVFGPTQAAARLEWSKAFAKDFMRAHHIPTARHVTFDSYAAARHFLADATGPWVVKADGLAAGKGVIVCDDTAQALDAVRRVMRDREFGDAGATVILEERLSGREASVLAFSDGKTVALMPPARDHKRVGDGDQGPNTGGMGAYTPLADVSAPLLADVRQRILQPAVDGMRAAGCPYVGVLYAGLMLTADGPQALEFNCRFGDPETQVILPLLESDLYETMWACVEGRLADVSLAWRDAACVSVVLASGGYPNAYETGHPIHGLDAATDRADVHIFHAATARRDGDIVTAGGRVLAVSALGDDLAAARERAYAAVGRIRFAGMHYRRDIGGGADHD